MTTLTIDDEYTLARNEPGENFGHDRRYNVHLSDHTFENRRLENFEQADLDVSLMDVIRKCKFTAMTMIQSYAIPIIADGRDLLAICETGAGKTNAFLLPIFNKLIRQKHEPKRGLPQTPLAVIVVPTRELAIQLVKDAKAMLRRTSLTATECIGGMDTVSERRVIERGAPLIIGTLGRILHFVQDGVVAFDKLRYLIIDEADQMLEDAEFRHGVDCILEPTRHAKPQIVMCSATFRHETLEIADSYLRKDHVKLVIGMAGKVNENVSQKVVQVAKHDKNGLLEKIIAEAVAEDAQARIMVFVETKSNADYVERFLTAEHKFKCAALHSDK